MIDFLILNTGSLFSLLLLLSMALFAAVKAPADIKAYAVTVLLLFALLPVFSIAKTTFFNQVPKQAIERAYVDQGVNKYQQSLPAVR